HQRHAHVGDDGHEVVLLALEQRERRQWLGLGNDLEAFAQRALQTFEQQRLVIDAQHVALAHHGAPCSSNERRLLAYNSSAPKRDSASADGSSASTMQAASHTSCGKPTWSPLMRSGAWWVATASTI